MVRVLLIDDDVWVRSAIRAMLEDAGYAVVEADGKHALRAFKAQPYNAILCDLFMPDKDGLEIIRELRGESPGARIIAISGGGFEGSVDVLSSALFLGADAVLHKPIGRDDLIATLQQVLRPDPGSG